jgi:hypothetical protein
MCHIIILIYNSCRIEDESYNKFNVLCHVLDNIGREIMSGKLVKVNPVCDGAVADSTVM